MSGCVSYGNVCGRGFYVGVAGGGKMLIFAVGHGGGMSVRKGLLGRDPFPFSHI